MEALYIYFVRAVRDGQLYHHNLFCATTRRATIDVEHHFFETRSRKSCALTLCLVLCEVRIYVRRYLRLSPTDRAPVVAYTMVFDSYGVGV